MDNMETDERGPCPSGGGVRPFVQSVKQSGPPRDTPARAAAFQLLWTYIVGVVGRLWHNERGYDIGQARAQSPSSITIAWNEDKENTRFEENLERIITQKWIAMFPLGIEAWCEHRRTGYPKFLPIMDNKGVGITNLTLGIRRLSYPAEEYQLNAENMLGALRKLNGEDNGATRLWWDCNPNVK